MKYVNMTLTKQLESKTRNVADNQIIRSHLKYSIEISRVLIS